MKGLLCNILENKSIGNCSNGGISSRCDMVTLVGEGIDEVFEANDTRPAVKVVTRNILGAPYLTAYPVKEAPKNSVGYMAGGCFIWTTDSRFPSDYPIPLHDRSETHEEYTRLSM